MMMKAPSGSIVVGIDGSGHANDALNWAVAAATHYGCALHLVHSLTSDHRAPYADPHHGKKPDWLKAQHWLDLVAESVTRRGVACTATLVAQDPEQAIVETADEARMIVIGSRGHGAVTGKLIGSVSLHVTHHAPCPVVVVREPSELGARRIVVGMDGSPVADRALAFALEHAAATQAPVTVIHAWDQAQAIAAVGIAAPVLDDIEKHVDEAERTLESWVQPWREKFPGVDLTLASPPQQPVPALLDASSIAALLVVGSHGRGRTSELLLGSVSASALKHATCPVAVIH